MNWVELCKSLPLQHSQRIDCSGCGGKKTASITNMGTKYVNHCFKCKETSTKTPPPMTPQERYAFQQAAARFQASEPALPDDFTTDIPIQGLLWLSKGGLHLEDIDRHGFGWSDTLRRVIMPVKTANGTLVAVQARRVNEGTGPKYLGQVWSGPRPVFEATPLHSPLGRTVVLTEDILSACRVAKVCPAWSLLGTNLMDAVIARLGQSEFTDVVVWMDDDDAGINARRKMLRQLGAVGIEARAVISDRDPKHHTLEEMKELLWN